MNGYCASGATQVAFDTFVVALKKSFEGEPWTDIEPWAERVWRECREDDDEDWESIKERVRTAWQAGA